MLKNFGHEFQYLLHVHTLEWHPCIEILQFYVGRCKCIDDMYIVVDTCSFCTVFRGRVSVGYQVFVCDDTL